MSKIQSIFGLQSRQIVEPQIFDVKMLHDQVALWRTRVRSQLLEYRKTKAELAQARFLMQRHYLNLELAGHQTTLKGLWEIYRAVTGEAWNLDRQYHENLDRRCERYWSTATG